MRRHKRRRPAQRPRFQTSRIRTASPTSTSTSTARCSPVAIACSSGSERAVWGRSTGPNISRCANKLRSRCSNPASRSGERRLIGSCTRPARSRRFITRTWSRSSTSASPTTSCRSSRWSYSRVRSSPSTPSAPGRCRGRAFGRCCCRFSPRSRPHTKQAGRDRRRAARSRIRLEVGRCARWSRPAGGGAGLGVVPDTHLDGRGSR